MSVSVVIVAILFQTPPPRYKNMSTEQDWTSVWPTAESFKWSVVPFPVRQGYARVSLSTTPVELVWLCTVTTVYHTLRILATQLVTS